MANTKSKTAARSARKSAAVPVPRTLTLSDSRDIDGISTLNIISGLQGVCDALDESAGHGANIDHTHQLAMAAKTLSAILAARLPGASEVAPC